MPVMLLLAEQQGDAGRQMDAEGAMARGRLAERVVRHLPAPGDHFSAVPGLSFYRRDTFCEPVSTLYEPSLSLVVQGRKRVVLGPETYDYDAGRYVLTSVDLPTIAQVLDGSEDYPFLSIMLKLDLAIVREVGGEIDLHGVDAAAGGSGMMIGTVTADLLDAIVRLAALADAPRDIPIIGRMVLREIVYRLLVGPAGAQLRQIAKQGTRCNRIAAVIAWLREHHAQPIRIEALAEMAAMGVSTLHHHFKTITRMSPLQYQKQIRLHEARRLLLTEPLDASTAAFRVGYETVTQFNREYRRLFGNPPIRDIARLRAR
jgi:AraC-like DNA-binding protein